MKNLSISSKSTRQAVACLRATLLGDFSPNHVNEHLMSRSKYKRRVAHGALLVGFMSTGSTRLIETFGGSARGKATAVSLGYDRVRFVAPVFIGDTITVRYQITRVEPERDRSYGSVVVTNQHGSEVAVADHILKWVPIELVERAETQEPLIREGSKFLDESGEGGVTRSQNHKGEP